MIICLGLFLKRWHLSSEPRKWIWKISGCTVFSAGRGTDTKTKAEMSDIFKRKAINSEWDCGQSRDSYRVLKTSAWTLNFSEWVWWLLKGFEQNTDDNVHFQSITLNKSVENRLEGIRMIQGMSWKATAKIWVSHDGSLYQALVAMGRSNMILDIHWR